MKKTFTLLLLMCFAAISLKAQVVITEISYNDPSVGATGDSLEFIELFNPDVTDIDISGFSLTTAVTYTFSTGTTIPAGGYLVVAKNSGAMQRQLGVTALQWNTGQALNNTGESIVLKNGSITIDSVRYLNTAPWLVSVNAQASLVLCNPSLDNTIAANWQLSTTPTAFTITIVAGTVNMLASPGATDNICGSATAPNLAFAPTSLSVNENAGTATITVSLTNPSPNPTTVDLILATGGSATDMVDFTFPMGTTTLTFPANSTTPQTLSIPITDDLLAEGSETFTVNMTNPTNGSVITTQSIIVTIADNDVSAVTGLVITEIMYNDPGAGIDSLEFIEIYNNTAATIALGGVHFSAGVTFAFPSTATIGAGQFVTVCSEITRMNAVFPQTFIYDYAGTLNNTGEPIVLKDGLNNTIDSVSYLPTAPWPTTANGQGFSLVLCDYNSDNSLVTNWMASTTSTGFLIGANSIEMICSPNATDAICTSLSLPNISFTTTAITIAENIGSYIAEVGIVNSNASATDVDVVLQMTGTAMNGTDFNLTQPMTLSFPALSAGSLTIPITITDDAILEGTETIVIKLLNVTNGFILPASETLTISITDNDIVPVTGIVITEIMYNDPSAGVDTFEFIEIYNSNSTSVEMAGCQFTSGVTFSFPSFQLGANQYAVIALDSMRFNRFFTRNADFQWTGTLINGGEAIVLRDGLGNMIDSVFYRGVAPWPTRANGNGPSLVLCDPMADNSIATSWNISADSVGVITVIVAGNPVQRTIWASPGTVDIACDTTRPLLSFAITNTTVAENVGNVAVTVNLLRPSATMATTVDVSVVGGTATSGTDFMATLPTTLTFAPGVTTQTFDITITDDVVIEATETIFLRLSNATNNGLIDQAAVNMAVRITDNDAVPITGIVITEIMYNEASAVDTIEYVELYNNTGAAIEMTGARLANGITFRFPTFTLNSNAFVVVSKDSAQLRIKIGVTSFQWDAGQQLNNTSEAIVLFDGLNNMIDSVTYRDVAPWATSADGRGTSIELCDYNSDNTNGANWYASTTDRGYSVTIAGPTPATYQVYCSPGARDSACATINVNEAIGMEVSIYPNPTTGNFNVELPSTELAQLQVFNSVGQQVHTQYLSSTVNAIRLENQPTGIYFVKLMIESTGKFATFKLIVE
jgi:Lamin Tail Domain/Calx-beta domain/Secretion system C-terminal sorting domain